jgi:predicted nucleic acid-binding protein
MKFKTKTIKNKNILIDTNIWIFLFSPSFIPTTRNQNKIDKYDNLFNSLIEDNNFLFNSLIISEFINRCLRIDFQSRTEFKDKNFKTDYRNSNEYKESLKLILSQVKKIYKVAKPVNDDFTQYNIKEFKEDLDFNDSIILFQSLKDDLLILTDDKDFQKYTNIHWWI